MKKTLTSFATLTVACLCHAGPASAQATVSPALAVPVGELAGLLGSASFGQDCTVSSVTLAPYDGGEELSFTLHKGSTALTAHLKSGDPAVNYRWTEQKGAAGAGQTPLWRLRLARDSSSGSPEQGDVVGWDWDASGVSPKTAVFHLTLASRSARGSFDVVDCTAPRRVY